MFERYTEKARRVIVFGRQEASNFGSMTIETQHLLLGFYAKTETSPSVSPAIRPRGPIFMTQSRSESLKNLNCRAR